MTEIALKRTRFDFEDEIPRKDSPKIKTNLRKIRKRIVGKPVIWVVDNIPTYCCICQMQLVERTGYKGQVKTPDGIELRNRYFCRSCVSKL